MSVVAHTLVRAASRLVSTPRRRLESRPGTLEEDKLKHVPHANSTTCGLTWGMLQLAQVLLQQPLKRAPRGLAALAFCLALHATQPAQPIAFSHKLHAGDYKIDCQFCHSGARRSPVSGIPSVQFCMGCHRTVAAMKPEIMRLRGYWDRKAPIRWARIVKEPDFVFFNHSPHIMKGIRCQECHGPIETMVQVRLDHSLNMDRCVSCHRQRRASIDCYTCHR